MFAADVPSTFALSTGKTVGPQRVVLYGPGGIGKSTLAAMAPKPVFIDLEAGTRELDVRRIDPPGGLWNWELLRQAVQGDLWAACKTLVIDTGTAAEEMCIQHVIGSVKAGTDSATSVESYGYGKGYVYVAEEFLKLLADLDQHLRRGRNVTMICHDCTTKALNPGGEDYPRWEPRLQSPTGGKNSIRLRVREWCDHLLFINYDVAVTKARDGTKKAVGSGTRTIYPKEMPYLMAKTRSLRDPIAFLEGDSALWDLIGGGSE